MLEIRNLRKTYRPKRGVPVIAVNDVSLKFPETGMVFLLGKSGSGKSTLLNLLGGLDRYDSGDILVKGQSTKKFNQSYYDSYRNTYVGFIFQEYNVLEEFSVGANIALALELQGQKATNERLNEILEQVDLAGYGNRKPNELSGGQKQRVAIARALVKNPKIIMADEPTGALDSATGRQVLDTLKKLSQDKLVIVVSHDREFAQNYGDRVIELADGKVIRDIEYDRSGEMVESKIHFFEDHIAIASDYQLTEEDRIAINKFLESIQAGTVDMDIVGNNFLARKSHPTDESTIEWFDKSPFQLIKSKLPLKNAFKIGASGLKHKKFRLVVTILLSVIAFNLFGMADTFGAYDHIETCVNSIMDSNIDYVSVKQAKRFESPLEVYYSSWGYKLDDKDLTDFREATGVELTGVFCPRDSRLGFEPFLNDKELSKYRYSIFGTSFSGFAELTKETLEASGASLMAGAYPDGSKNEIAITTYLCQSFMEAGYYDYYTNYILPMQNPDITMEEIEALEKKEPVYETITKPEDMVGKILFINEKAYTISGILDFDIDWEHYAVLKTEDEPTSDADMLVNYALYTELNYLQQFSFASVAMVGEGHLTEMIENEPRTIQLTSSWVWFNGSNSSETMWLDTNAQYLGTLEEIKDCEIIWLDGEKTTLGEKEIIVATDTLYTYDEEGMGTSIYGMTAEEIKAMLAPYGQLNINGWDANDEYVEGSGYTIVGVIDAEKYPEYAYTFFLSDSLLSRFIDPEDMGIYEFAVGAMPKTEEEITTLVEYCYDDDMKYRCELENPVTYELDTVNEVLQVLAKVFLGIGIGFAIFASIMLANFISTSIAYKKQEIGILRAIGSRGNDVFRIFFSESFIIAMINFVLSSVGVGVVTFIINWVLREKIGILVTILTFGIRQIGLIFMISVAVAFLASFIPVRAIAAKRPIDAIRNR